MKKAMLLMKLSVGVKQNDKFEKGKIGDYCEKKMSQNYIFFFGKRVGLKEVKYNIGIVVNDEGK